jgi:hypothetical protein
MSTIELFTPIERGEHGFGEYNELNINCYEMEVDEQRDCYLNMYFKVNGKIMKYDNLESASVDCLKYKDCGGIQHSVKKLKNGTKHIFSLKKGNDYKYISEEALSSGTTKFREKMSNDNYGAYKKIFMSRERFNIKYGNIIPPLFSTGDYVPPPNGDFVPTYDEPSQVHVEPNEEGNLPPPFTETDEEQNEIIVEEFTLDDVIYYYDQINKVIYDKETQEEIEIEDLSHEDILELL